jgi:CRP-like cAMP-binding protein
MDAQHPNQVLASLNPNDFELLRPHLRPFELVHEDLLFDAGEAVNWVYFPHSGVISLVVGLADGQLIEAAMVGRDSLVGGSAALDGKVWLNRGIVQVEGKASILSVETLCQVAAQNVAFRTTLIRHEQALFAQAQQSAACNASHSVEARLSRWLLRTRDLGADARRAADQRFARGPHAAECGLHPLSPGPRRGHQPGGAAGNGLRVLRDGQIAQRTAARQRSEIA